METINHSESQHLSALSDDDSEHVCLSSRKEHCEQTPASSLVSGMRHRLEQASIGSVKSSTKNTSSDKVSPGLAYLRNTPSKNYHIQ